MGLIRSTGFLSHRTHSVYVRAYLRLINLSSTIRLPIFSGEKSKITHISEGFDFLSQNLWKYNGKLLIHPSKGSVQSFKNKIKQIIRQNRGISAHALIRILNLVIRGWSNYHKGICSKSTFDKWGYFIFKQPKR